MPSAKRLIYSLVGLIILLILLFINQWIFNNWFNISYFDWYLQEGALIGAATAGVSMVWGDIREHTGLISANPWNYLGSYLQLVGLPIFVFGTHLKRNEGKTPPASIFDVFVTIIFGLFLCAILLIWLVVAVPLQYFVYLICGAPGRLTSNSQRQAVARLELSRLEVKEISKGDVISDGWWNASITDKPVTITSLFSSLFFLIAQPLLG